MSTADYEQQLGPKHALASGLWARMNALATLLRLEILDEMALRRQLDATSLMRDERTSSLLADSPDTFL